MLNNSTDINSKLYNTRGATTTCDMHTRLLSIIISYLADLPHCN